MFHVGDWIRVRLAHDCGHFHAADADGRIGKISGVVTAELLARDNASAVDQRDILTLEEFRDHVYSIDFNEPESPDAEFCSLSEMEALPGWANEASRQAVVRSAYMLSSPAGSAAGPVTRSRCIAALRVL